MKKTMLFCAVLACALLALLPLTANAATCGEFDYSLNYNGDGVSVTAYRGAAERVVIPAELDGNPVISLGYDCFGDNATLRSVVVPEGCVAIDSAFDGCVNLAEVTLPSTLRTIRANAFRGCAALTGLTLPEGLTSLEGRAFRGSGLTAMHVPDSVTEMDGNPFAGCAALKQITFSENHPLLRWQDGVVVSADGGTLLVYPCSRAETSFTLPEGVTVIGEDAFTDAPLETIVWNDSVTNIRQSAFSNSALREADVPQGVQWIGNFAFFKCEKLERATLPESVTRLGVSTFYGCKALKTVALPSGLRALGGACFQGCASLREIALPSGVTELNDSVFYDCVALETVNLPEGLTELSRQLFYNCASLRVLTVPETVTSLDDMAFYGCAALEELTVPGAVTDIGDDVFEGCQRLTLTVPADSRLRRYAAANGVALSGASPEATPAPLAPDAFRLRGGVGWQSTLEQVEESENIWSHDGVETFGNLQVLYVSGVSVSKFEAELMYLFRNGALTAICYGFEGGEDDMAYLRAALGQKYGAEAGSDASRVARALTAVSPRAVSAETVRENAFWLLPDGTLTAIFCTDENALGILYANEPSLLREGVYNTRGL